MRTTLDIDPEVLEATKEIALRTRRTAGQVLSDLARHALASAGPGSTAEPTVANGFEIVPAGSRVVTSELVRKLIEDAETP